MGQFKPMPKMETTEPSVELKLKKGGRAKKMAMGGNPMMAAQMPVSPRRRMAMGQQPMMMRKNGGMMESMKEIKAHERNERDELKRVEKELKSHEKMRASKGHQGLKNGGAPKAGPNMIGGLEGGLEATRADKKKTTGGVLAPGYKNGGALNAKGMALAKHYETNINDGSSPKKVLGKTGGVSDTTAGGKPAGYKKGGSMKKYASGGLAAKGMALANKYQTKINSGDPMPTVKGSTKGVKVGPAGYKDGGHVAMTCKSTGGYTAMKKMQKC